MHTGLMYYACNPENVPVISFIWPSHTSRVSILRSIKLTIPSQALRLANCHKTGS